MFPAVDLGRAQVDVRPRWTGHGHPASDRSPCGVRSWSVQVDGRAGCAGVSNSYDFVLEEVDPRDEPGVVVEVTAHCVADHHSQTVQVVSFGEDAFA